MQNFAFAFEIVKLDDEKRLVGGIVYEPDVVDSQGDSASAEEIEKGCHRYMASKPAIHLMHKEDAGERVSIVECYITRQQMQFGTEVIKAGSWMIVVKVHDDEIWNDVKKGALTGFSMGGRAKAQ